MIKETFNIYLDIYLVKLEMPSFLETSNPLDIYLNDFDTAVMYRNIYKKHYINKTDVDKYVPFENVFFVENNILKKWFNRCRSILKWSRDIRLWVHE